MKKYGGVPYMEVVEEVRKQLVIPQLQGLPGADVPAFKSAIIGSITKTGNTADLSAGVSGEMGETMGRK